MNPGNSISEEIRRRLARVRSVWLRTDVLSNTFTWLALSVFLASLLVLLEAVFRFDSPVRTGLVLSGILCIAFAFVWFVARPVLRLAGLFGPPDDYTCAAVVGGFFPQIRDRLLNLLQLQDQARAGTLYSRDLIDASFSDLDEQVQTLNFTDAVDRSPVRRYGKLAAVAVVGALVIGASAPSTFGDSAYRLFEFRREFAPPVEVLFEILPGNREILKGESVDIAIRVIPTGVPPAEPGRLSFRWRPQGQTDLEEAILQPASGRYRILLENVRSSTEYFALYEGVESEHFQLRVVDRPVIRSLRVRLDFPPYSKLPTRIQDEFVGDVSALPGTTVQISGTSSKDLADGALVFTEKRPLSLRLRGVAFSGRFILQNAGSYHIELRDTEELSNADPVSYQLVLLEDASPTVRLLRPGRNLDIAGVSSLPLLAQIKDDYGFSRMRLGYRLIHSRYETPAESPTFADIPLLPGTPPTAEVTYDWDLRPLGLVPEDVVEYFIEVEDNDAVSGPKRARSEIFTIRLPSLEEVFTDLDRGHEKTLDELRETVQEAEELKERIESINRDLKTNKPLDWQQQRHVEETAKKYQELQEKLNDAGRQLETMVQQMQEQRVLSGETLEKYLELQQLFEQLNSAELQRAFQQMEQALQSLNKQQLQQALQQVMFSEDRFRESIQRTLDLLKRIQIEQKLDELSKRADELTTLQRELQTESQNLQENEGRQNDLARRQDDLARKLEQLQRAAEDLQQRMEEYFTEMPERELEEALQALQEKNVADQMRRAGQELRQSRIPQALQQQDQIRNDLQQFSDQLNSLQMQMMQQQQQQVINELRRALGNLLELSKREESLKEQSRTAPANSPQLRENAQNQMGVLNDLGSVISALQELSKRSFAVTPDMGRAIGEALARMRNAMTALETRSGGSASQEQAAAMSALNKAAQQVQSTMQSLMQSSGQGGGGLMGQLQALAGQQMSLNMRTLSVEDAARLAVEQEVIRKSLEQLNREAQASGEQRRILGDLENIAREMQQVVKNLEQQNVGQETVQKQERILSRLLDAARSTRERDFEKKRKSETGTPVVRQSPADIDPSTLEGRDRLREDLYKALEYGYSKDYEDLIRKYFQHLEEQPLP